MKKIFVLIAVVTSMFVACSTDEVENTSVMKKQSRYISKAEAQKQVLDILGVTKGSTRADALFEGKTITSSFTRDYTYYLNGKEQTCDMYVFNFGDNDGYAAVASDVRTDQLLVLTNEGKLEENSPSLDELFPPLEFGEEEPDTIDHPDTLLTEPYDVYEDWTVSTVGYSYDFYPSPSGNILLGLGLAKAEWHQFSPFNNYCFTASGAHAPTGCVAVATAMLLSCYEHPTSYGGYTFDWPTIKATPDSIYMSSNAKDQIARLMEVLGRSENLDMTYDVNASTSSILNVPRTLQNLGFTNCGYIIDYNLDHILLEIGFGYPIIVRGQGQNDNYGHTWLIDAYLKRTREIKHYSANGEYLGSNYQTKYYLHCNWGIEQSNNYYTNGFFLNRYFDSDALPAISPSGVVRYENPVARFDNLKMVLDVRW